MAADVAPVPRTALSIEEACASISVSKHFWYAHIAATMPTVRINRVRLVPVAALEEWLLERASTLPDSCDPGYAARPTSTNGSARPIGRPRASRGPREDGR